MRLPEGLESIEESAFKSCTGIRELELPGSVTDIGNAAFAECTSLTEFYLPDNVTRVAGNPFVGCKNLREIRVSETHPTLTTAEGLLMDKTSMTLLCYPYTREDTEFRVPEGTRAIGPSAFESTGKRDRGREVPQLHVILPDTVEKIGSRGFQ